MTFSLKFLFLAAVCLAILGVPQGSFSWGSATHTYIMKHLSAGQTVPLALYGSVAPDIFNIVVDSEDYGFLSEKTHKDFLKIRRTARTPELRSFASGFLSHNERWGADYSAHVRYRGTRLGYIRAKSISLGRKIQPVLRIFFEDTGIPNAVVWANFATPLLSHPLLETAIDLLVRQNLDPDIGMELAEAASTRPDSVPDLIVSVYRNDLMNELGMTAEKAESLLRDTEAEFRATMIDFGEIISRDRAAAVEELARQGAILIERYFEAASGFEVKVPLGMLIDFFELATAEVAGDYREAIEATITRMLPLYGRLPF